MQGGIHYDSFHSTFVVLINAGCKKVTHPLFCSITNGW